MAEVSSRAPARPSLRADPIETFGKNSQDLRIVPIRSSYGWSSGECRRLASVEFEMEIQSTATPVRTATPLDTFALAIAFGVAGIALVLLWGVVMGATWGMMGGGSFANGSMMGYGGGAMRGGGLGMLLYALVVTFVGGALVGGVTAAIYNKLIARSA